jgi:multiple sugar transport system substrate-binding protein
MQLKRLLGIGILFALLGTVAAQTEVVWWDFLSGGDGVRMKAMIDEFNATHDDIQINATTSEWGVPFYTKVQTAVAVGEQPDIMTYHVSRFPLAVPSGILRPFSDEELASVGLSRDDYFTNTLEAATVDGELYGVPFDISTIILFYNKDILDQVGLLGEDGLPQGIEGIDNFNNALQTIMDEADKLPLSISSDNGTVWRTFYTLLKQQEGAPVLIADGEVNAGEEAQTALQTMKDWVDNGYAREDVDYPSSIALFANGEAAFMINGVWEVPTIKDLAASGDLAFDWGAVAIPVLFDVPAYWADTHTFAIPNSKANPISEEKLQAVLEVIAWMNKNSIMWASAGHIPAYTPVVNSPEYQELEPNATYAEAGEHVFYDPRSPIAGVATPTYDAVGNYFSPAINGQLSAEEALQMFSDDLQSQMR